MMRVVELRNDGFYDIEFTTSELSTYKSLWFISDLMYMYSINDTANILYHPDNNRIEIVIVYSGWRAYEVDNLLALSNYLIKFSSGNIIFDDTKITIWGKDSKSKHMNICKDIDMYLDSMGEDGVASPPLIDFSDLKDTLREMGMVD